MATTDVAVPTTPPSTYVFGTAGEASILASLAGTNIANKGTVITYSADDGQTDQISGSSLPQTIYFGSASSGIGWNSLSSTAKYAIYAGAGAMVLIVITLASILVVRKRRANKSHSIAREKAIRMTQRSSFASPFHDRGSMTPSAMHGQARQNGDLSANYSTTSFQTYSKADMAHADAQSVHSIPPLYAANGQQRHYEQYSRNEQNQHSEADRSYDNRVTSNPLREQYDGSQYQQHTPYADYSDDHRQLAQYPPQSTLHQSDHYQGRFNPYSEYTNDNAAYTDHAGHGANWATRQYRY